MDLNGGDGSMTALRDVEERVRKFASDTEGVVGVILATPEGFPYAYFSKGPLDAEVAAAFVSSVFAFAKKMGRAAEMGRPLEINLHFGNGSIYVFPLGELVLGVRTLPGTSIGMVLMNARKMLKDLKVIAEDGLNW